MSTPPPPPPLPEELARFTASEGQHRALKMLVREYGQACRKQALEDAALACESEARRGLDDERAYNGTLMAEAIRSLK